MSSETRNLEANGAKPKDLNDVEMLLTPKSPKAQPDVHLVANERKQGNTPQYQKQHSESSDVEIVDTKPTQPLLEPGKPRQQPPLAGPEIDDLDDEAIPPADQGSYPGIDDGLLNRSGIPHPEGSDHEQPEGQEHKTGEDGHPIVEEDGHTDGKWWRNGVDEADYPYDTHLALSQQDGINGFGPKTFEDRPISPFYPNSIPDVNTYQQKKNLAQGMMDLALLSANANQLRYVLESSSNHPYFYPSVVFISLSIILQIAVGVGLIMNSRYNVKDEKDICKADKINNMTVLGVFMVTIVNVFITSFSVANQNITAVTGTAANQQSG